MHNIIDVRTSIHRGKERRKMSRIVSAVGFILPFFFSLFLMPSISFSMHTTTTTTTTKIDDNDKVCVGSNKLCKTKLSFHEISIYQHLFSMNKLKLISTSGISIFYIICFYFEFKYEKKRNIIC
jgi:hypothetical protein